MLIDRNVDLQSQIATKEKSIIWDINWQDLLVAPFFLPDLIAQFET